MEKLYIRKSIAGNYIEFPDSIDSEYWAGKIGSTYEDYLDNKWIELSDSQVAFHEQYPQATIKEVLEEQLTPAPVRTLQDAKDECLAKIIEYDESYNVNSFDVILSHDTIGENNEIIEGQKITTWLTPSQRSNYKNSVDAALLIGIQTLHPVMNGIELSLSTQDAQLALARIQLYADTCYNVTERHKDIVKSLTTVKSIDEYDYTVGYPEKLTFDITGENEA